MQCEICGSETALPKKINLDGSHMLVCKGCATYGVEERTPQPQYTSAQAQKPQNLFEMGGDIIPGFGKVIMQARQRKDLTFDELGKKVFEKASLLHRIESEAVKPSPKLVKKLENELGIKLTGTGD